MVKGNFARFDTCNREFHKISQTFGMRAELLQIQSTVNHEVSPDVRRALPDQTFDTYKDTKQVQIHLLIRQTRCPWPQASTLQRKKALLEFLRECWETFV
jgi:hypothetical protein